MDISAPHANNTTPYTDAVQRYCADRRAKDWRATGRRADVSSSEITPTEYLRRYAGRMPGWLRDYRAGGRLPLREFLRSRCAYYPGGRFDMNAVDVFGRSGVAHCIVYADYGAEYAEDSGLSVEALREFFSAGGLPGYNLYDARSISEQELLRAAPWRPHVVPDELRMMRDVFAVLHVQRFAELYVLDRAGKDPAVGPERLAILYLGADGFATYDALFANGNAPKFVGMVLQDHGFGGNWDCFGIDGLLERIAQRSGVFPQFIHYGQGISEEPWRGYALVPGVAPTEYRDRRLYERERDAPTAVLSRGGIPATPQSAAVPAARFGDPGMVRAKCFHGF